MPLNINRWLFVRIYFVLVLVKLFAFPISLGRKTERTILTKSRRGGTRNDRNLEIPFWIEFRIHIL
jgi:hypothetical protein